MTRMDVESLRSQGPCADVENDGQTLAGDHVEDFLHEDESLARGEVGHPASSDGEAFTGCGRAVLRLRLYEGEFLSPQILLTVGDFNLIAAAHCGG